MFFEVLEGHTPFVTMHPNYMAMSNQTVLKNVGPLPKDRNGRAYRHCGNQPENYYIPNVQSSVNFIHNTVILEVRLISNTYSNAKKNRCHLDNSGKPQIFMTNARNMSLENWFLK